MVRILRDDWPIRMGENASDQSLKHWRLCSTTHAYSKPETNCVIQMLHVFRRHNFQPLQIHKSAEITSLKKTHIRKSKGVIVLHPQVMVR